jgi:hypothetical protein
MSESKHPFDELDGGVCECGRAASDHIHHWWRSIPWCEVCRGEEVKRESEAQHEAQPQAE